MKFSSKKWRLFRGTTRNDIRIWKLNKREMTIIWPYFGDPKVVSTISACNRKHVKIIINKLHSHSELKNFHLFDRMEGSYLDTHPLHFLNNLSAIVLGALMTKLGRWNIATLIIYNIKALNLTEFHRIKTLTLQNLLCKWIDPKNKFSSSLWKKRK